MYEFYFQKLGVWQQSRNLVLRLYQETKSFPDEEKFNLTSQIRRAVVSIPGNIAEGIGKSYFKDQARFTSISYASLMEVLSLLILSQDLGYLNQVTFEDLQKEIESIARQLNALRNSQIKLSKSKPPLP